MQELKIKESSASKARTLLVSNSPSATVLTKVACPALYVSSKKVIYVGLCCLSQMRWTFMCSFDLDKSMKRPEITIHFLQLWVKQLWVKQPLPGFSACRPEHE